MISNRLVRNAHALSSELRNAKKFLALIFINAPVTIIAFTASAQTQLLDEHDIYNRYVSCLQSQSSGIYNSHEDGPKASADELRQNCWTDANVSVFIDNCVALDSSWLQWGRHGKCAEEAKKRFNY